MAFKTKLDYSDNRQIKQRENTITSLSGRTDFGVPYSALTGGANFASADILYELTGITSTFSGNLTTTIFNFGTPEMEGSENYLNVITPSNQAEDQVLEDPFFNGVNPSVNPYTLQTVYEYYTGSTFDLTITEFVELTPTTFSGTLYTELVTAYSATSADYTGDGVWTNVNGILQTNDINIVNNAIPSYVLICQDNTGRAIWQSASALTTPNVFISGTSGDYSIRALNDTNIDATGEYSFAVGVDNMAPSYGETSLGVFGTTYSAQSTSTLNSLDRIFNIGIGADDLNREDALTIMKSGSIYAPSLDIIKIETTGNKSLTNKEYLDYRLLDKQNLPTGFVTGLTMSINPFDNTKVDLARGAYVITDFNDILDISVNIIEVPDGITGITPTYLTNTGVSATYIGLDINQNVIQQASPFDNDQRRHIAPMGIAVHSNHINVNVTNETKTPIVAPTSQLHDFIKAVGFLNLNGNVFSPANPSVDMSIQKTAGQVWGLGINGSNYEDPHRLSLSGQSLVTFRIRKSDGTETVDLTALTASDLVWEDTSTSALTLTSIASNRFGIFHGTLFQSGITRLQYPQNFYSTLAEGLANVDKENYIVEKNISDNGIFRFYLVIQGNTNDFNDPTRFQFVNASKFGSVIGAGGVSMTFANIIAGLGYTPENVANKQNSLAVDGTGTKYPTVDAVNSGLTANASQLQLLDEGSGNGWRLLGADPANYGNIGIGAVDLSYSSTISSVNGATGAYSYAQGNRTRATDDFCHAEGDSTLASGNTSHAEGLGTQAIGITSHAEGDSTIARGNSSHAQGSNTEANGDNSHAEGENTITYGDNSHAEGSDTIASGTTSHAEGSNTQANNFASHAEGEFSQANGVAAHAEGNNTKANGIASHAEGSNTTASGLNSHAEGNSTQAVGNYSHAEGNLSIASGQTSHAEGLATQANGLHSHSEGHQSKAFGLASHAEGHSTQAVGNYSHAEGDSNIANGDNSHAEGNLTNANGANSHAEGSATIASGDTSHAEGSGTQANGQTSHAEGIDTKANGSASHAQGYKTISNGINSHTGGGTTGITYTIQANGISSFNHSGAFAIDSKVDGNYSAILGGVDNIITSGAYNSVILGGINLTGSSPNTVYVPALNINNVGTGPSTVDIGVDANGNVVDVASDFRLKENINTIENALDKILNLRGVTYNWKDRENGTDALRIGFIAQEVKEVVPELVYQCSNNEYFGVHYSNTVALLVEAVKELSINGIKSTIETQTIKAEDNNIELNYNGTHDTAIGGGIKVLKAVDNDTDSSIYTDSDGDWVFSPNIKIPYYTPKDSNDSKGNVGNICYDDNYQYIKTNSGWMRTPLNKF